MANLSKYELAVDRYNTLLLSGLTVREALNYMISNVNLYIILQNIDSPQDRNLMNVQLANVMWYTKNVFMDSNTAQEILTLNTTNTLDPSYGEVVWDSINQTLAIGMGDGVVLQSGQELLRLVRNNTVGTIANGTVVKMTNSDGVNGRLTIAPATGLFDEAKFILGITTHDIEANSDGFVTAFGYVRSINTTGASSGETWVDGDILYVKPSNTGKLTKVVPTDIQLKMPIAKVVKAHTTGTLEVFLVPINENAVAATAKKLATAREIKLSGIINGSANFDGSGNIVITTEFSPDFVETNGMAIFRPIVTFPLNGAVNFNGIVTSTYQPTSNFVGDQDYVRYELSLLDDFSVLEDSYEGTDNLSSWNPDISISDQVYYLRVKQGSDFHRSSWSTTISFRSPIMYIATPTLTVSGAPSNVLLTPTLTTSAFSVVNNTDDTHESSDWLIIKTSDGSTVYEVNSTINKTSLVVPSGILSANTEYTFKVKYNGSILGSSPYGSKTETTVNIFVNTPTVSVTGAPLSVTETPTISTTAFSVFNGVDTHASTDWFATSTTGVVLWSSLGNTIDKTSIVVPAGVLSVGTEYIFKARHNGTVYGGSGLGTLSCTTLVTFVETPTFSIATSVTENNTLVGTITNYDAAGTYHISADIGSITYTSGSTFSYVAPSVAADSTAVINIYSTVAGSNSAIANKNITVLNIVITADAAVVISSFSDYELNEGWLI